MPIGADRELALVHVPSSLRDAFAALFTLDAAMGDVVARSTEPALGRIKLAWWRERLEALDSEPPPAEPRLRAAADHLVAKGIKGADLAGLEPGWATLLDPNIDPQLVAMRGAILFAVGGRLLGSADAMLGDAGALYALASVGRRGVPELFEPARENLQRLRGSDASLVRERIEAIPERLEQIWSESAATGRDPAAVADAMAQRLIGRG